MKRAALIQILAIAMVVAAMAQKPTISNAKLQEVSAAGGLKAAFDAIVQKQDSPAWIGYRVPVIPKERTMCCFDSVDKIQSAKVNCCMGCRVESSSGNSFSGSMDNCQPPEPFRYAFVFFRVETKRVQKIRTYSPDCALDFANLPVYWLENVDPAQSVQLLTEFVLAATSEDMDRKKSISNAG